MTALDLRDIKEKLSKPIGKEKEEGKIGDQIDVGPGGNLPDLGMLLAV